jgi:hypothetical protein
VPLIKISKHYVVDQNEDSITVDIPKSMLWSWQKDYEKIANAQGILEYKKEDMLAHLQTLRQEWIRVG